jgi:CRP-like cAMP-binding protein
MKRNPHRALSLQDEPFFRDMSAAVVARLEGYVYHRDFETRQIIFFPEDPCDYMYWVREGRVRVSRMAADNREFTFRHLIAGEMLGEDAIVDRPRREHYAEAMEPTVLCLMRMDDFRRVMREEPELASKVAEGLCKRVVATERVLAETVFNTVRSRVASGLLRMYQRERHGSGTLRVTHQEIANLIGSTRETTTNVLHSLRAEGILQIANRRLTVLDPVALEQLARQE